MIQDYNNGVYELVSDIVKLNFKDQIKNSGIVFEEFYKMSDLVNGNKFYLLKINKVGIQFENQQEFVQKFIELIKRNLEELNDRYKRLNEKQNDPFPDESLIKIEHEEIGHKGSKQLKLLNKFREFRNELPNINE